MRRLPEGTEINDQVRWRLRHFQQASSPHNLMPIQSADENLGQAKQTRLLNSSPRAEISVSDHCST